VSACVVLRCASIGLYRAVLWHASIKLGGSAAVCEHRTVYVAVLRCASIRPVAVLRCVCIIRCHGLAVLRCAGIRRACVCAAVSASIRRCSCAAVCEHRTVLLCCGVQASSCVAMCDHWILFGCASIKLLVVLRCGARASCLCSGKVYY
jgi:hypothetical protein